MEAMRVSIKTGQSQYVKINSNFNSIRASV